MTTVFVNDRSRMTAKRIVLNRGIAVSAVALGLAAFLSLAHAATESPIGECDRLASADYDYQYPATGIPDEELLGKTSKNTQAEKACRRAFLNDRENARIRFQLARALILGGKPIEGEKLAIVAAESNYRAAKYFLGKSYYRGWIESPNFPEAINWLSMAADQGHPDAQHMLGAMYRYGRGVNIDLKKAYQLLSAATKQGNVRAGLLLGGMYYEGAYVDRDIDKAFQLFQAAADKQIVHAQYTTGVMYLQGEGTRKNSSAGLRLLMQAAEKNYLLAQVKLGNIYYEGQIVEEDKSKSRRWFCRAGALGMEKYFALTGETLTCTN